MKIFYKISLHRTVWWLDWPSVLISSIIVILSFCIALNSISLSCLHQHLQSGGTCHEKVCHIRQRMEDKVQEVETMWTLRTLLGDGQRIAIEIERKENEAAQEEPKQWTTIEYWNYNRIDPQWWWVFLCRPKPTSFDKWNFVPMLRLSNIVQCLASDVEFLLNL